MPRYLALEAETTRLHVLSGAARGGSIRLDQTISSDDDKPLTPASAAELGAKLKALLKDAKIAPAPLLICVGRDRVVMKEVRIPRVRPHEEPAVVRFQAMREFTENFDEIVIDYAPAPGSNGDQRVQVVSIRKEFVQACKRLAEAAGLKLAAITPRSYAILAGLKQAIAQHSVAAPDANAAVAVLVRGDRWGELLIARGGNLLLARSLAGPVLTNETALIGELRRNLAIHANQNPDAPVRLVYLPEAESIAGIRDRLQSALDLPVHAYDPLAALATPESHRGTMVGLAGTLALAAPGQYPINFAQPREPKPPRDPNKRMLAYAGIAAAILIVSLGAMGGLHIIAKERMIVNLEKEKANTDRTLRQLDPDAKRLKALEDWVATDVNWLDELYDATARTPDLQKIRITAFTAAPIDNRSAKSKYVATVSLRGIATDDHKPIDGLMAELNKEDPTYKVLPKQIKRNQTLDRFRFRQEFTMKYELVKRAPENYTRSFTASPPTKRSRNEDAVGFPDLGGMFP